MHRIARVEVFSSSDEFSHSHHSHSLQALSRKEATVSLIAKLPSQQGKQPSSLRCNNKFNSLV